jgi:N utilization substance protein B
MTGGKSARRRAREYAVQGLYQWQLADNDIADVASSISDDSHFPKADGAYFIKLLKGVCANAEQLQIQIAPALDRKFDALSPVERSILLLATYELTHQLEIPYRVVINEAIELAKTFGGTDGHKYVNGVLDKIAPILRPEEKASASRAPRQSRDGLSKG